jgi:ubiquitin-protein ligase
MMKEIQDKRLERGNKKITQEIALLEESTYPVKQKKIAKGEYHIEVEIKVNIQELEDKKITFLIHIVSNFPFNPPKVYCKTGV